MSKKTLIAILIALLIIDIALLVFLKVVCPIKNYDQFCPIEIYNPFDLDGSLFKLEQECILDEGKRFNEFCDGLGVSLENLYLYPLDENDSLATNIYLYGKNSYEYCSPNSVNGDILFDGISFVSVEIANLSLLAEIGDIAKSIQFPVALSDVSGIVRSTEKCTQFSHCRYDLRLELKAINLD